MMPPPRLGERVKRRTHLRVLERMMRNGKSHLTRSVVEAPAAERSGEDR